MNAPEGQTWQRDIFIQIRNCDAARLYLNCAEATLFSISFLRSFRFLFL
jgi:hypothetical protein